MKLRSTTKDYPVNPLFYYILYYKDFFKPKILTVFFTSKKIAQYHIKKCINRRRTNLYEIVKGSKIKGQIFPYARKTLKIGHERIFVYPKHLITRKDKRNYRIIMRRRLRRMKMYFKPLSKGFVTDPNYKTFLKPNYQVLAQNKSGKSIALGLKVDRIGDHYLYVLIRHLKPKNQRVILYLEVVKINLETGEFKKRELKIYHHDILRPFLLTEVYKEILHLENKAEILQLCVDNGVKFSRGGTQKILLINNIKQKT